MGSCDGYAEGMIARIKAVYSIPEEYSPAQAAPLCMRGKYWFWGPRGPRRVTWLRCSKWARPSCCIHGSCAHS
jgi:hypothetical protein